MNEYEATRVMGRGERVRISLNGKWLEGVIIQILNTPRGPLFLFQPEGGGIYSYLLDSEKIFPIERKSSNWFLKLISTLKGESL